MAAITELSEGFEAGVVGASLSTGSTIFNTITGTGTAATFVNTSYANALAMNMVASGGVVKTYRSDFATQSSAWYGFALRIDVLPSVVATVYQVHQSTTLAFSVRINTDGTLQLRDGTTTRFTSPALTVGAWHWVSVKFTPGSATGARLKVYDASGSSVYDSTDGVATSTTATAMDNMRVGYLAGGGDITFSMDRLEADDSTEISPLVAGSGPTEIEELHEDFENGADGDIIWTSDTIFTSITGTGADATFADNPYEGILGMRVVATGGLARTYRVDFTSQTDAWYGFALRVDALPTAVTTVYQIYQSTTLAFSVRVNTDGTVQLRDGTVTRFTSPALTVTEWYWISVHFKPGDGAGARLKVYNRAATSVYDSGGGAATSTAATAMDNLRAGFLAGTGDASFSIDRLRADTTSEIAALPDEGTALTVKITSSPASPEADDVVTLVAAPTGATGPYSYSWSQPGGTAVSLSGSGDTRTFTAPMLIDGEILTFRCDVTPTAGAANYDLAEVPILPHNFWTMHGGILVPRKVNTQAGGSLQG